MKPLWTEKAANLARPITPDVPHIENDDNDMNNLNLLAQHVMPLLINVLQGWSIHVSTQYPDGEVFHLTFVERRASGTTEANQFVLKSVVTVSRTMLRPDEVRVNVIYLDLVLGQSCQVAKDEEVAFNVVDLFSDFVPFLKNTEEKVKSNDHSSACEQASTPSSLSLEKRPSKVGAEIICPKKESVEGEREEDDTIFESTLGTNDDVDESALVKDEELDTRWYKPPRRERATRSKRAACAEKETKFEKAVNLKKAQSKSRKIFGKCQRDEGATHSNKMTNREKKRKDLLRDLVDETNESYPSIKIESQHQEEKDNVTKSL